MAGRFRGPTNPVDTEFDERTKDCAFVEDRIVTVGEVFGKHDQNDLRKYSRGFVVEFGVNGVKLAEDVATDMLAWQGAVRGGCADKDGGYVVVGYTCDAKVVPCTPTVGVVKWFSLDALVGLGAA
jgi:hypothetical protein